MAQLIRALKATTIAGSLCRRLDIYYQKMFTFAADSNPPTIGILMHLKNIKTKKTFNLVENISADWEKIGYRLKISDNRIRTIGRSRLDDDEKMCEVFRNWTQEGNKLATEGNTDYFRSWDGLHKLLQVNEGVCDKFFEFLRTMD